MKSIFSGARRALSERLILFIAEDSVGSKPGKNHSFARSLRNAVKGIAFAFLSTRNFRIELASFATAVFLGFLLGIDRLEWAILLTNCFLVLALEAKNTSIELSVDLCTEEYHYGAKGSKDSASGAVLLISISALVNGLLIFGPRILELFRR